MKIKKKLIKGGVARQIMSITTLFNCTCTKFNIGGVESFAHNTENLIFNDWPRVTMNLMTWEYFFSVHMG